MASPVSNPYTDKNWQVYLRTVGQRRDRLRAKKFTTMGRLLGLHRPLIIFLGESVILKCVIELDIEKYFVTAPLQVKRDTLENNV